jgi:hypothetical protein
MKKAYFPYLVILSTITLILSCNKNQPVFDGNLSIDSIQETVDTKYDAAIWINYLEPNMIRSNAYFKINFFDSKNRQPVSIGKVKIDTFDLTYRANKGYNYIPEDQMKNRVRSQNISALFGKEVEISYDGNLEAGFFPFKTRFQVASKLAMTFPNSFPLQVNENEDIELKWSNPEGGYNVILEMKTSGEPLSSSGDGKARPNLTKTIEDNGNYTIKWNEWQRFKDYPSLSVNLIRFNAEMIKSGEKRIALISSCNKQIGSYKILSK